MTVGIATVMRVATRSISTRVCKRMCENESISGRECGDKNVTC
jgi:hypothetical protein